MVFSSSIFLFWFLPLTLLVVYILPQKWKNTGLLFASLLFYSWGEPKFILVMLASIIINYLLGLKIEQAENRKLYLILAITANLSILAFFKYAMFITENINIALGAKAIALSNIYLPIGISFFTFQAISYIVDVYQGETEAQRNPVDLALFISLFPQLIAGPIVRYHDINEQLKKRQTSFSKFSSGVERFIIGLAKKVLLANNFAYVADNIFGLSEQQLDTPLVWMGILAYTFQIYFDFSGYSDMAIGLGRMFGFELLENFNYPYISKSIIEFWRRWHISLSTWFRDYLYIPLGGNRVSTQRVYLNLLIVFFLTGLWHGASWNFVVWGLFHGFFLIIERFRILKFKLPALFSHLYVLLVVIVGWVFFRAENLSQAMIYLQKMCWFETAADFPDNVRFLMSKELMWVSFLAVIFSMPTRKFIINKMSGLKSVPLRLTYQTVLMIILIISLSYIAADTYNPFIYFRF